MTFGGCCCRIKPAELAEGGECQAGQSGFHVYDARGMLDPRPGDSLPQSSNQRAETFPPPLAGEKLEMAEMAERVLPAVPGDRLTRAGKLFEEIIMRELGVEQPDLFMAFQRHLEEAQTAPTTGLQSLAWSLKGPGVKAVFEVKPGRDRSAYAVGWAYHKKQPLAHDLPVTDDWELPLRTRLSTSFTDAGARSNMSPCVSIAVPQTNPAPLLEGTPAIRVGGTNNSSSGDASLSEGPPHMGATDHLTGTNIRVNSALSTRNQLPPRAST